MHAMPEVQSHQSPADDRKSHVPAALVAAGMLIGLIAFGVYTVKSLQRAEAERQRRVAAERREDFILRVKTGDDGHKVFFFNDPLLPGELVSDPQCVAKLKHLSFFLTDLTDPRYGELRQLVNVRSLCFYDSGPVDVFLRNIAGMPSVETIFFESGRLLEKDVGVLSSFPNLKSVRMWHRLDENYRVALDKAIPKVEIVLDE